MWHRDGVLGSEYVSWMAGKCAHAVCPDSNGGDAVNIAVLVPYIFLLGGFLVGVSIFWYLRLWERGEEGRWDRGNEADPVPRTRRLPRLFLIGFSLCVLSGPLTLWLLISGDGPQPVGELQLQRVLEERLPDPDVQRTRHEELVTAIRGVTGTRLLRPGVTGPPVTLTPRIDLPKGADLIPVISCLLLLAAGLIALVNLPGFWGKLIGALASLGGLWLFVVVNPGVILFAPHGPPATEQVAVARTDLRFERLGAIGPFPSACDSLAVGTAQATLRALTTRIEAWAGQEELGFILVIGSVDHLPLAATSRARFGSNVGLAQARADWAKAQMVAMAGPALDAERVIPLAAGPAHAGREILAADRMVAIYACWHHRPME